MIKPELKRLLNEHSELVKKRKNVIDKELKEYKQPISDMDFKEDIEMKLHELAIKLLENQGFPFGEYRIKEKSFERMQSDFALMLSLRETADKKRYILMKGKRRKLWNMVHFLDLNSRQSSLLLVLSMLGSSFIKLVMECKDNVNELTAKRVKVNENIVITDNFKVDKIIGFDVKQEQCRKIDFRLGESSDTIDFGLYDNEFVFLNDKIYNSILNSIKEKKDEIKKYIKFMDKTLKDLNSHINEPYLGMLGLE